MSFLFRSGTEVNTPRAITIALDLGEPQFDLVEPGRVRWGEVQMNVGVLSQELVDALGLVRREVVGDDVDVLSARAD